MLQDSSQNLDSITTPSLKNARKFSKPKSFNSLGFDALRGAKTTKESKKSVIKFQKSLNNFFSLQTK